MNETFEKIMAWIKSNVWLSVGIALVAVLVFFPKLLRVTATRRRRRSTYRPVTRRRRTTTRPKRKYSKGGTTKKPWQIKGSLAAKRYMAKIRRKR